MVFANPIDWCSQNYHIKFKNLRRVIKSWQSQLSSLKSNIANVKLTLSLLGLLEEFRDLTLMEWNFKALLEAKLLSLLKQQKIYWKQKGTIGWVTKGDACTIFFHANATIRHRKNLITSLEDSSGVSRLIIMQKQASFLKHIKIDWVKLNMGPCF